MTAPSHNPPDNRRVRRNGSAIIHAANREIEEIRQAYRDQSQQQSVLGVDTRERVSF